MMLFTTESIISEEEERGKMMALTKRMNIMKSFVFGAAAVLWIFSVVLLILVSMRRLDACRTSSVLMWYVISASLLFLTVAFATVSSGKMAKATEQFSKNAAQRLKENQAIIATLCINFNAVYFCDTVTGEIRFLQLGERIQQNMGDVYQNKREFEWYARAYCERLVIPDYHDEFMSVVNKDSISDRLQTRDYFTYRYLGNKNGAPAWYEMKAVKVDGDYTKFVLGFADVDEEAREEATKSELVKNSLEQVAAANRVKDKFLSNMSHELLTPLNEVLGLATLMSIGATDDACITEDAAKMAAATKSAVDLIEDLLYKSRIVNGEMILSPEPCSLTSVLDVTVLKANERAIEKKIRINRFYSFSHDCVIMDKTAVKGIIDRLLGLAIKYSMPDSVIDFEVKEGTAVDNKILYEFRVVDYGNGMTEKQKMMAMSGGKLDPEVDYSPTGVSLSIARNLVELMNGQMSIDSAEGRGTSVVVRLFLGKSKLI